MASVRKRDKNDPKSPWVVAYTDASGVRRLRTPTSGLKKDADALRKKIEREMGDGTHVADRASVTLGFAIDEYLKDCERRHRCKHRMSGHYLESVRTAAKSVPAALRRLLIVNVSPRHIQDVADELARRFRPNTVRNYIGFYRPVMKFAIKQKWLVVNHLREQPVVLPEPDQPKPVPSKENIRKLLEVLACRRKHEVENSYRSRVGLVTLALFTTMRKGEIVALRWENVDFTSRLIRVRHSFSRIDGLKGPKSRSGVRDIAMAEPVRKVLDLLHETSGRPETGYVLHADGEPEKPIWIGGIWMCTWAPLMRVAGLVDANGKLAFTFHQMRHAAVSLLIEQGLDPMLIKQIAGHSSIKMTMDVYGHLFPEDGRTRVAMSGVAAQFNVTFDPSKASAATGDATKTRLISLSH